METFPDIRMVFIPLLLLLPEHIDWAMHEHMILKGVDFDEKSIDLDAILPMVDYNLYPRERRQGESLDFAWSKWRPTD